MKKFLSLVLALVMTMSLATISAGATEYKDLTDKDEIQYEEAVAVLNRIGIITGYEDGSFRPETELTRGAAAKIIVSLMIGPEAASALPNDTSPYPDVPAGHTFAGVISYCKTAGYISGYSDGTFKPANSLTGFAFAKMLLGAVGYKSELEGFTGTGWTMNVARLGNIAGLFNRLSFQGADAVNREEACQLALNTLKATMVEYTGGFTITTGDAAIVGDKTRTYVTSNQAYAKNISNRKLDTVGNSKDDHYTVEFGEEHFKDLRLDDEHKNAKDDFGRPSNVWSYKKVTIGTFPIAPDFTFDKQAAYSDKTDAVKNRATGLGGYTLESDEANVYTRFWVNGTEYNISESGKKVVWGAQCPETNSEDAIRSGKEAKISNISDLTDNGTVVEVYVSEDEADFITDVVVVKSQLMEVKKVGSDYVSLEKKDPDDGDKDFPGFNQDPIDVKVGNVQAEDAPYAVLKDLKAGDNVVIIPVDADHDGEDFEVAEAYEPETVSGTLTGVKDYGPTNKAKNAVSLTVGGTDYSISLWNKDMSEIDGDKIKVTKKDVTLTLDKHGYALLAEDVGSTSEWMVIGSFRSNVENGRIVTVVTGWDISGEPVELNLGPNFDKNATGFRPGDLVKYESTSRSNLYDWVIGEEGVYDVFTGVDEKTGEPYKIKASNVKVDLRDYGDDSALFIDKGVKFIYVSFDNDNEVESIEVKSEVKTVENKELRTTAEGVISNTGADDSLLPIEKIPVHQNNFNAAQAAVTSKGAIKAVVIKQESNEADSASMLYVRDMPGGAHYDSTGKMVYVYTVAMNTADGVREEETIYSYDRLYRGDFASYAKTEHAEHDEFYTLRQRNDFTQRTTSTFQADIQEIVNVNASLVELGNYKKVGSGRSTDKTTLDLAPYVSSDLKGDLGVGDEQNIVSLRKAVFVDLTKNDIDSFDDLKTFMFTNPTTKEVEDYRQQRAEVQLVVNDNPDTDGFRRVAMVIITGWVSAADTTTPAQKDLLSANIKGVTFSNPTASETVNGLTQAAMDGDGKISFTHNGKEMEIELTHNGSASTIQNGSTVALAAGDTIKVTVYARNHTSEAPNKSDYTFTIGAAVAAFYENTVATGLGVAKADDASTVAWDALKAADTLITPATGALTAAVVLTGKDEDTVAQLKLAMDFLGESCSTIEKGFNFATDHKWIITTPKGQVTFDESTAHVFVTVGDKKVIAASGSANLDDAGLTLNAKVTELDGTVSYVKTADLNTTALIPGAKYVNDAFVVFNGTAPTHNVTGFTVSYTMNGEAIADGDSFDKGSDLVITIKATATGGVKNSADVTTAGTLAFATAIPGAVWAKSADTVEGSGSGDTWTFAGAANAVIVPENESITVTVEDITSDLNVPALTYTASHN